MPKPIVRPSLFVLPSLSAQRETHKFWLHVPAAAVPDFTVVVLPSPHGVDVEPVRMMYSGVCTEDLRMEIRAGANHKILLHSEACKDGYSKDVYEFISGWDNVFVPFEDMEQVSDFVERLPVELFEPNRKFALIMEAVNAVDNDIVTKVADLFEAASNDAQIYCVRKSLNISGAKMSNGYPAVDVRVEEGVILLPREYILPWGPECVRPETGPPIMVCPPSTLLRYNFENKEDMVECVQRIHAHQT